MDFYDDIDGYGDLTALIDGEACEHVTYNQLLQATDRLAAHLPRRCVILSVCSNTVESVVGYLACLRARVVPVLVPDTLKPDVFVNLLIAYRPACVWLPAAAANGASWGAEICRYRGHVLVATEYAARYSIHDDLALLLTTSGSTGSPMLVRQSYLNISSNAAAIASYLGITQVDRPMTSLPMSYTYGLSVINSHLLRGSTVILTDRSITERAFWDQLKRHEATTFSGVPYTYEMLKALKFSTMTLPSLKTLTQAGGTLGVELAREFALLCAEKGIRFFVMYGQTEATARMSYLPWEYAISKAGSVGIAIPGGEFWLEDDEGRVIPASETVGELVFRGNGVTPGYAASWEDLGKGDENHGVLRTGDLARRDADGFYYIVGRKKRFLKVFGNRLNLDELEHLLGTGGFNCVCGGRDDRVRIYVSEKGREAAVRRFVAGRTSIHPYAFEVVFTESIPRNDVGKIQYAALE